MLISSEGIVLKQRKIANNRRIIILFTKRYGKISAGTGMNEMRKGRAALAIRPFTYAKYDIFKNRGYYNINAAEVIRSYYSIGEKLERFSAASHMIEYLDAVTEEGEPMPHLFDLSMEMLDVISIAEHNFSTMFDAYLVKTFGMLGIMPEIRHCLNCGKPYSKTDKDDFAFSVEAGGILCNSCIESAEPVPGGTADSLIFRPSFDIIVTLHYFIENPLKIFTKVVLKSEYSAELRNILNKYVNYYLDVDISGDELSV